MRWHGAISRSVDERDACIQPCPKLANLQTRGATLVVSGPARSMAELVEPPPQF
jgi:hypothetical protein